MEKLLKYKISLPGIKGFARHYLLKPGTSLFRFHRMMVADMDFPQDQIVIFKAVDEQGGALARFSMMDLGQGTIDSMTAEKCHKAAYDHFVYFYDTTNRKSVLVDYEGEVLPQPDERYPQLLETESVGPNPIAFERGYVALEDMPDDKRKKFLKDPDDEDYEEDEDDEEEDVTEEGEEIYGEEEGDDE